MKSGTLREWSTQDKTDWGPGPWQDEPDKRQWVDGHTGLPCLMVRNMFGTWCGYVGLDELHPLHGATYSEAGDFDISVHGGLTYDGPCQPHSPGEESKYVCHIPEPGMTDKVHWLGFDCGHCDDIAPAMQARMAKYGDGKLFDGQTYRDTDYVQTEVESLALQLKNLGLELA